MGRYSRRVDDNQEAITKAVRQMGVSVWVTSSLGDGAPDEVWGFRGKNWLVEIKDGEKYASQRKLTPCEKAFHDRWRGQIAIISNLEEAVKLINSMK